MNKFNLILASGKVFTFDYESTGSIMLACNMNQVFMPADYKNTKLEVPANVPKAQITAILNMTKPLGLAVIMSDKLHYEKSGVGGEQTDWDNPEEVKIWMKRRGVNVANEEHVKAVLAVLDEFDKAEKHWSQLKSAKIVGTEGKAYFKTIDPKSKKS